MVLAAAPILVVIITRAETAVLEAAARAARAAAGTRVSVDEKSLPGDSLRTRLRRAVQPRVARIGSYGVLVALVAATIVWLITDPPTEVDLPAEVMVEGRVLQPIYLNATRCVPYMVDGGGSAALATRALLSVLLAVALSVTASRLRVETCSSYLVATVATLAVFAMLIVADWLFQDARVADRRRGGAAAVVMAASRRRGATRRMRPCWRQPKFSRKRRRLGIPSRGRRGRSMRGSRHSRSPLASRRSSLRWWRRRGGGGAKSSGRRSGGSTLTCRRRKRRSAWPGTRRRTGWPPTTCS